MEVINMNLYILALLWSYVEFPFFAIFCKHNIMMEQAEILCELSQERAGNLQYTVKRNEWRRKLKEFTWCVAFVIFISFVNYPQLEKKNVVVATEFSFIQSILWIFILKKNCL